MSSTLPRGVLFVLISAHGLVGCSSSESAESHPRVAETTPIRPAEGTPSYWSYDGKPLLLLGGSKEDNLFQISDLEAHLDRLAGVGGNYVRNTMSSRDSENVWPFHQLENGQYDLTRLNDEYYQRFERLLSEAYDFADVSQNNHNADQEHWDNLQWVRRYVRSRPRPLNNVKIYGADTGEYGTTRDGIERFWRSLFGGAASARFHCLESGIGLSEPAQNHLRSARALADTFDVIQAQPDTASAHLLRRNPDEAYLMHVRGEAYAVYFPDGGSVELDLSGIDGSFRLQWLEAAGGSWSKPMSVDGGQTITLDPPSDGHWIALLSP